MITQYDKLNYRRHHNPPLPSLFALSVLLALAAVLAISQPVLALVPAAVPAAAPAQTTVDYDTDGDNYIEVANLAQLDAIRYDLNADGAQGAVGASDWANYTAAFLNA